MRDAILLSLNGDFAEIAAYPPADFRGIVAVQLHNHPEIIAPLMRTLCDFLRERSNPALYAGKLIIAEVHRIRT